MAFIFFWETHMKLTLSLTATLAAATVLSGCGAPATNTTTNTATNRTNTTMAANNSNTMAPSNTNTATGSNPMVGGAAMLASRDIVDNAVESKDHTTLVAAVKAADLVATLKGAGPFTVFAPTNAAFDKVPKATLDGLLKPESKKALSGILTYHVVAGKQDAASIAKAIEAGNGKATFKTVAGGNLTASLEGTNVILTDENGGKSTVTIADVMQSNGVIHVVDKVLMPKS